MARYRLRSEHHGVCITRSIDGVFQVGTAPVRSEDIMRLMRAWHRIMGPGKPLSLERVDGK